MERYLKGRLTEVDQIIIENSGNKFDAKKVFHDDTNVLFYW